MKGLFAMFSLLSVSISSIGQTTTEKTLLWEVTGNGITKPSYLFGTIHLMCPNDMRMPELVKEKFNTTEELFLEIDMDDPNMMKEMLTGMKMKDNSTLQSLLGSRYDSISKIFQHTTGFPLMMMNSTKPFLLMSMIYPSMLGCTPESWEGAFQKMAKEKNIEIKGLETLQDQMAVFEKIPYKVQSEMFAKLLLNIDSSKKDMDDMMKVYKDKDIDQLTLLTSKDEDISSYEGALLNDRNRNWIPIIGEQAKKKPTFFAFGAGHLGGEKGVINLLRKSGFKVKAQMYNE